LANIETLACSNREMEQLVLARTAAFDVDGNGALDLIAVSVRVARHFR